MKRIKNLQISLSGPSRITSKILLGGMMMACLVVSGQRHVSGQGEKPKEVPACWVSSNHAVYTVGEAITIVMWVAKQEGPIIPRLEVRDKGGKLLPERKVQGRTFSTSRNRSGQLGVFDEKIQKGKFPRNGGRVDPYLETIADLRVWYNIDIPGEYTVRLIGDLQGQGGKQTTITSNVQPFLLREKDSKLDRTIPLKDIWAFGMPHTKKMDVSFVFPKEAPKTRRYVAPEGELMDEIRMVLRHHRGGSMIAPAGFVVEGVGIEALREAYDVLVKGKPRRLSLAKGKPASVIFFAYISQDAYVHLTGVEQRDYTVELRYRFVFHDTRESAQEFAIIPLGTLPAGTFRVVPTPEIDPTRLEPHYYNFARNIPERISQPFSFIVK